jgi:hypothetical protein
MNFRKFIFENAFSDEWTVAEPDPPTRTTIIDHVIRICDFPSDSVLMKFIDQQQWSMLEHDVSAGFDDVGEFFTVRDDGNTFEVTPMLIHLPPKIQGLSAILSQQDMLG